MRRAGLGSVLPLGGVGHVQVDEPRPLVPDFGDDPGAVIVEHATDDDAAAFLHSRPGDSPADAARPR